MVARITGDGQAPALDGVGEQHAGPVLLGVALAEGGQQRAEVMAGQVGDQAGELGVAGDARAEVADRAVERVHNLPGAAGHVDANGLDGPFDPEGRLSGGKRLHDAVG